ncbi:tetratricopeptide repeat protein [Candidatus Falkowbacteria bacterium]|nr:tetratricopeptide repeat protein [Candidatus Falkowbacteria bacterium]
MTQDFFDTNMWMLLVGTTILIVILWGLRVVKTGAITITWNGTVKRLGLLAASALVSLLVSPNKTESVLAPFGLGTFLSLFLIALVGATFLDEQGKNILKWCLFTTVSLAGLLAIYQFFGFTKLIEINVSLMTVFIVTLPIMINEAFHKKQVAIVMSVACLGGLVATAYQVLPNWGGATLPYWANWQIMLESYKNIKQLFVGVGAENFLGAFTVGRPVTINMTDLWNTRFIVGSSMLFHIATVYGIIGAAAFIWFLTGLHPAILFPSALSLIFLPPSFGALVVIVALLMLTEPVPVPKRFNLLWLRYPTIAFILILIAVSGYGLVRAYGAELAFSRSLRAFDAREGTNAYNLQIQAITLNPNVTRFHTAYAQTNLALADAIAKNASASAEDRKTTTQLIQQAIREAKIAVGLSPTNILAWENIASVYQALTGVAQGADQWTVAAYQQAMQLDPTNPSVRLRLGGAFVGQQKLDQAEISYLAAIQLKSDYANAYYNLAFVYRQQKKYLAAAQSLKEALAYVTPGSDDERQAKKELDEVSNLLTEAEKQSLNAPAATPTPKSAPLSPLP